MLLEVFYLFYSVLSNAIPGGREGTGIRVN